VSIRNRRLKRNCLNRYVDGLGTFAPDDQELYAARAQRIVRTGR
jgi:hypothetical protein